MIKNSEPNNSARCKFFRITTDSEPKLRASRFIIRGKMMSDFLYVAEPQLICDIIITRIDKKSKKKMKKFFLLKKLNGFKHKMFEMNIFTKFCKGNN